MRVVVFEDDGWSGFGPLNRLRHGSLLSRGTKSLLDGLLDAIGGATEVVLWGREELSAVSVEQSGRQYNTDSEETSLYVNARARPDRSLAALGAELGVVLTAMSVQSFCERA